VILLLLKSTITALTICSCYGLQMKKQNVKILLISTQACKTHRAVFRKVQAQNISRNGLSFVKAANEQATTLLRF